MQNASLRHSAPFPLTSGDADDLGGAKCVEAVHEGDADVNLGGLTVRIPRHDAFAKSLEVEPVQRHRFERTGEGIFASMRLRAW